MARQVLPIVGAVIGGIYGGAAGAQWGYAIGSVIGNAVDPQVIKGPKLGEAGLQTSAEGVFRPIVFGTGAVKGNVICRGNRQIKKKREQQGKGGPVSETERVYWTFAIRICEAKDDAGGIGLLRIWEDEKLVYDITPESQIAAESIEYSQRFRFYNGSDEQLPDPDLEAFKGAGNVPAYRGTCYAVFPNYDLTDTGERIKDYRWEVSSQSTVTPVGVMMAQSRVNAPIFSIDGGLTWDLSENSPTVGNRDIKAIAPERFMASQRYTDDLGATAWSIATSAGTKNFEMTYRGSHVVWGANGPFEPPQISSDGGMTAVDGGASGDGVYSVVYIGASGPLLGVGKDTDFMESTDNGASFSATGIAHGLNGNNTSHASCAYSGGAVFAGSNADITQIRVVFTENGTSFVGGDITGLGSSSTNVAKDPSRLCVGQVGGTETVVLLGNAVGELFWTQDEGTTWTFVADVMGAGVSLDAIAWNGVRFVLCGRSGSTGVMKHSADLVSWTDCIIPGGSQGYYAIAAQPAGGWIGYGERVSLASIISVLCERPGLPASRYDVSELTDMIDGLVLADDYSYADAIRTLMPVYFYGASEHDAGSGYKLHFPKHGKAVVETLTIDDFVSVPDKTVRQDAYERPRVLHMHYQSPTVGYAPAKASPSRFSPDVKVVGEQSIQVPVSFKNQDEAWQRADKILKIVWTGIAGEEEFSLPMSKLYLVPTDAVGISLRGQVRRMVFSTQSYAAGVIESKLVADRQGNYTSTLTGIPLPPPTPPPPSIVGPTIMAFGDWPALNDNNDRLLYYVGATGQTEAWHGAQVDRSTDSGANFTQAATFNQNTIMGVLQDDVTAASRYYTDTTNVIRVRLYLDDEIESLTEAQFNSEGGAFMLGTQAGWEMIQYRDAEQDTDGDWLLTTLKRGQLNTDPIAHAAGAMFVLLDGVKSVDAVTAWLNTDLTHRATSAGRSPDGVPTQTDEFTGASQREFPVASVSLFRNVDEITVTIIPRHRFGTESNPIRSINWERYTVEISDGSSVSVLGTTADTLTFDASALSSPITVSVAQRNRLTGEGPFVSESIA